MLLRSHLIGGFDDDLRFATIKTDRAGDIDDLAVERLDVGKFRAVVGEDHRSKGIVGIAAADVDERHAGARGRDIADRTFDRHRLADMRLGIGRRDDLRLRQSRYRNCGKTESRAKHQTSSQNRRFHITPLSTECWNETGTYTLGRVKPGETRHEGPSAFQPLADAVNRAPNGAP